MDSFRVKLTKEENLAYYGVPENTVIIVPTYEYLTVVLNSEMLTGSYHMEALKAGVVAAYTFAVERTRRRAESDDYDVEDNTNDQAFNKTKTMSDRAYEAVDAVFMQILYKDGIPFRDCEYRSDPPEDWENTMSQTGANELANSGYTYKEILEHYYEGTYIMDFQIRECLLTENDCYKEGTTIVPCGIMVHDTGAGNPYLSRYLPYTDEIIGDKYDASWNESGLEKCVHGFIGKGADDEVYTYQTLPFTMKGWHAGGSANKLGYIGFEMCDDGYEDEDYFNDVYAHAVEFCAYLCKAYSLSALSIIGHYEGHALGIASNHADPETWFSTFGKSMDIFRQDVADAIGEVIFIEITRGWADEATVTKIQEALIAAGDVYKEALGKWGADGDFGGATETALELYQTNNGLTVTGTVNLETWNALFPEEAIGVTVVENTTEEEAEETEAEETAEDETVTEDMPDAETVEEEPGSEPEEAEEQTDESEPEDETEASEVIEELEEAAAEEGNGWLIGFIQFILKLLKIIKE